METNLVKIENGQPVTSSRKVAEDFGKEHRTVLRSIDEILSTAQNCALLFHKTEYVASNGKHNPEYLMNRDGFTLLAMSFTGAKAMQWKLKYIAAFNQMEQKLALAQFNLPNTLPDALRFAAVLAEKNEVLQLKTSQQAQLIDELKPKADYTDIILKNKGLVTITQIAKDYGMSGKAMNKVLHDLKVQYNQSGQWLLYSNIQGNSYTHSETFSTTDYYGRPTVNMTTKWTQKGRLFLYNLLKENGVLPMIEKDNVA